MGASQLRCEQDWIYQMCLEEITIVLTIWHMLFEPGQDPRIIGPRQKMFDLGHKILFGPCNFQVWIKPWLLN